MENKEIYCPICSNDAKADKIEGTNDYGRISCISCPSCGKYAITENLKNIFKSGVFDENKHIVAGFLCETKNREEQILISNKENKYEKKTSITVDQIIEKANKPRDLTEQLDRLLLIIDQDSKEIGKELFYVLFLEYPRIYAKSMNEFKELLNILEQRNQIKITGDNKDWGIKLKLCDEGYKKINILKKRTKIFLKEEMSEQDILKIIAQKEGDFLEFKSSMRWCYKEGKENINLEFDVAKAIAAFMNAGGGILVIGVDDGGNVLGIKKDYSTFKNSNCNGDKYIQKVTNVIIEYLGQETIVYTRLNIFSLNDKEICVVNVFKSEKPIYLKDKEGEHLFARSGTSSREFKKIKEACEYVLSRFRRQGYDCPLLNNKSD